MLRVGYPQRVGSFSYVSSTWDRQSNDNTPTVVFFANSVVTFGECREVTGTAYPRVCCCEEGSEESCAMERWRCKIWKTFLHMSRLTRRFSEFLVRVSPSVTTVVSRAKVHDLKQLPPFQKVALWAVSLSPGEAFLAHRLPEHGTVNIFLQYPSYLLLLSTSTYFILVCSILKDPCSTDGGCRKVPELFRFVVII